MTHAGSIGGTAKKQPHLDAGPVIVCVASPMITSAFAGTTPAASDPTPNGPKSRCRVHADCSRAANSSDESPGQHAGTVAVTPRACDLTCPQASGTGERLPDGRMTTQPQPVVSVTPR